MKEKQNIKQKIKEFWEKQGPKIKIAVRFFIFGWLVGFIRGIFTSNETTGEMYTRLIDKIPYEPDCNDMDEWVLTHMDDLKEYYELHSNQSEEGE